MSIAPIFADYDSPMTTSYCPNCGQYTYVQGCGGIKLDQWTQTCWRASQYPGCITTFYQYQTLAICTNCNYSPSGPNSTHNHIYHSVCGLSAGCPFDNTAASIEDPNI